MPLDGFIPALIYSAILTVILFLWYLPTIYMLAYTYVRQASSLTFLRYIRHPLVGMTILLAIFGYGGYLSAIPSYTEKWRANLSVVAHYNAVTKESRVKLVGDEFFRNVEVSGHSLTRVYNDRVRRDNLDMTFNADWLTISGSAMRDSLDAGMVTLDWELASLLPWFEISVYLKTDTLDFENIQSEWHFTQGRKGVHFNWYSQPPQKLQLTAQFKLPPVAKLIRTVKATYTQLPEPLKVKSQYANVVYRTYITQRDTIVVSQSGIRY